MGTRGLGDRMSASRVVIVLAVIVVAMVAIIPVARAFQASVL